MLVEPSCYFLKPPSLRNSFSPGSGDSLGRRQVLGYQHPDQRSGSLKVSEFKRIGLCCGASFQEVVRKSLRVWKSLPVQIPCRLSGGLREGFRVGLRVPLVGYLQGEQGYNCPLKIQKQIESNLFKSGKQPCCEARISFCEARNNRSVDPLDLF